MTYSMTQIEGAIRGIAEAREFIRERASSFVTREELDRLVGAVGKDLSRLEEVRRRPVFGGADAGMVRGDRYDGLTHFDLSIVKALREAAEFGKGRAAFTMDVRPEPDGSTRLSVGSNRRVNRVTHGQPGWEPFKRALDSTTAGIGDEIVPTGMATEIWRDVHLSTVVSSFLPRITMPTNPFDIPLELGDVTFYKATENTTVAETDLATTKNTLTAGGVKAITAWSYELDEDAIMAMLPSVREVFIRNTAEAIDDLLLQADSTATNSIVADGATLPATSRYLYGGGDGLLHLPLVDNTGQAINHNAAISAAMFKNILTKMEKYALNPAAGNNATSPDLVFISDVRTWLQAIALSEVITVDKLGPQATIRTGQLAMVYGVPYLVSGVMGVADTDGKVTPGGNATDTGRVLVVNRQGWFHGFRREMLIETERDIEKTQIKMVVSFRIGLVARGTRSTAKHAALAYDITGV